MSDPPAPSPSPTPPTPAQEHEYEAIELEGRLLIGITSFLMLGAILGLCLHGLKYDQVGISGYAIMRFAYFYAPSLVLIPVSNQRNPVRFGFYNSALTSCHACKQGLSSE